jgi:anthranilate phosphoribosyltransferase
MGSGGFVTFEIGPTLDALCAGRSLSRAESQALFSSVMRGEIGEVQLAALLVALKAKGETPDEIAGAACAMREAALPFDSGGIDVADSCGTGGDGMQTVNISTAAALVAAAAGVAVAKHGNRSISSRCGSADVLEQCGVRIDAPPELSRACLERARVCFLFAPQYHAGVRHAMPVRKALGARTIFNLLGPLVNPAQPRWQVMGVYDPARCTALAETLGLLGCERALVVHGSGLDEIALHGETSAALLEDGRVRNITMTPSQVGLPRCDIAALRGGDPSDNARWLTELLAGGGSEAHRQAVAINAGALLWISGREPDHRAGTRAALEVLSSGAAAATLARWRQVSHGAS